MPNQSTRVETMSRRGAGCVTALMSISSHDVRYEIERREHHEPDDVDEVPVECRVRHREMPLRGEVPQPGAQLHDDVEEQADEHVRAVKAGDREEERAVGVRLEREVLLAVLDPLHDEKRDA